LKFTHDFLDQSSDFWKIELISQDKVLYSFKSRGNVMEKISDKITLTESGDYYIRVSQHVHFRQVDYSIAILE
jgi:hypothetical protein